ALAYLDSGVIGLVGDGNNTVNNKLQSTGAGGTPANTAMPGLGGQISPIGTRLTAISSVMGISFTHISTYSVSPGGGIGNPLDVPIAWTPIGQTDPVNVKLSEMGDIMNGIAGRRADLLATKVTKTGEVNALTDITAVIAYDATAGW